jgi:hypothetical protein
MAQLGNHADTKLEENLVRYMILNKIRVIRQQFSGDIVIACDGKNTWRRQCFPYYKAKRRSERKSSEFNWNAIYDVLNKVRDELKENFSYIVIHIDGAEADDIIASLVMKHSLNINNTIGQEVEPIVIISGDKDFVQLQKYPNVEQYCSIKGKAIKENNPVDFVKRHIIKGDKGDGVPNVLSDDDSYVNGSRQKKITENFIVNFDYDKQPESVQRNYKRNELLIDLHNVPADIQEKTVSIYNEEKKTSPIRRQRMFNYFISKKLKNFMENVGEF